MLVPQVKESTIVGDVIKMHGGPPETTHHGKRYFLPQVMVMRMFRWLKSAQRISGSLEVARHSLRALAQYYELWGKH
jgi:hypothetical protein